MRDGKGKTAGKSKLLWCLFKGLYILVLGVIICHPVSANDFYLDWQLRLLKYDPVYRTLYEEYQQDLDTVALSEAQWLPQISVDPLFSLSKVETEGTTNYNQSLSLGLNVSQKLPWGGGLSGAFSQVYSRDDGISKTYGFSASGSLNYLAPLQLWDQGFGLLPLTTWHQGFAAGRLAEESRWNSRYLKRVGETLKLFIGGMIDLSSNINQKKLVDWYARSVDNDKNLWEAGKISAFQQSENINKSTTNLRDWLQSERSLISLLAQIKLWNLNIEEEDPLKWISKWETVGPIDTPARVWDFLDQKDTLLQSKSIQWEQELSFLPQVSISYSYTPGITSESKMSPEESVKAYWEGPLPWNWILSASIHWPLVPWDPVYHLSEQGVSKRKAMEARERDLLFRQAQYEDSRHRTWEILNQSILQSHQIYLLEKDRNELYELKLQVGQISAQDREYQEIQTETARLNWLRSRLDLLVFGILGE